MDDAGFPVRMAGDVPVVGAPEEIDISNADSMRTALLMAAAAGHGDIVIDMSQTYFCGTAGLHALVGAHKRAQSEGGQVRLVVTSRAVVRILAITGVDKVIPRFTSMEDALASASRSPQESAGDVERGRRPV